jgi:hypothetical protein
MHPPGSPDNEERRLLAEHETVTGFYSWTVRELSRQRGTLPNDQYIRLLNMVENARFECERARLALWEFRAAHKNSN